jgi:hypothetical protein
MPLVSATMQLGISFLTPADTVILLTARNIITRAEAVEALEHLRPLIRMAAYYEAREHLEHGGER